MKKIISVWLICVICCSLSGCAMFNNVLAWMEGDGEYVDFSDSRIAGNDVGYFIGEIDIKEVSPIEKKQLRTDFPAYQSQAITPNFFRYRNGSDEPASRFISGNIGINRENVTIYDAADGETGNSLWIGETYNLLFPYRSGSLVHINSFFGWRNYRGLQFHNGVDMQIQPKGDAVNGRIFASGSGTVSLVFLNSEDGYGIGNTVFVTYENVGKNTNYSLQAQELRKLATEGKIFLEDKKALQQLENALGNAEQANVEGQKASLRVELGSMLAKLKETNQEVFNKLPGGVVAMILDFSLLHYSAITGNKKVPCEFNFLSELENLTTGGELVEFVYTTIKNHIATEHSGNSKLVNYYTHRLDDAYKLYANVPMDLSDETAFIEQLLDIAVTGVASATPEERIRFLNAAYCEEYTGILLFGFMEVYGESRISDMLDEIAKRMEGKNNNENNTTDTVTLIYQHLKTISVVQGQKVTANTQIGTEGGTGSGNMAAYGTHLHLVMANRGVNRLSDIWIKPGVTGYCVVDPLVNAFGVEYEWQGKENVGIEMKQTTVTNCHTISELSAAGGNKTGLTGSELYEQNKTFGANLDSFTTPRE